MSYALRIDKQAAKTLKTLDQPTIRRLLARLEKLSENPIRSASVQPFGDGTIVRKSRVGNWRIFFEVDDSEGVVAIVAIKPRSRAYRKI